MPRPFSAAGALPVAGSREGARHAYSWAGRPAACVPDQQAGLHSMIMLLALSRPPPGPARLALRPGGPTPPPPSVPFIIQHSGMVPVALAAAPGCGQDGHLARRLPDQRVQDTRRLAAATHAGCRDPPRRQMAPCAAAHGCHGPGGRGWAARLFGAPAPQALQPPSPPGAAALQGCERGGDVLANSARSFCALAAFLGRAAPLGRAGLLPT